MRDLYFIGDIHGRDQPLMDWCLEHKHSDLIQVGDFGLGFAKRDEDRLRLEFLSSSFHKNNNRLFAIRGNHDDPSFWTVENSTMFPSIHLVPDNTLLYITGRKVFFCGGAISVDRIDRVIGRFYWADEGFGWNNQTPDEPPDIVVTHTCGSWAGRHLDTSQISHWLRRDPALVEDLKRERFAVDALAQTIGAQEGRKLTHWIYGHMHTPLLHYDDDGVCFRGLDIDEVAAAQSLR